MKSTIASPVRQNGSGHELQKSKSQIVSKNLKIILAPILISLLFSCLLFGQQMTAQQKQILENIEQQNKIEAEKQNAIKKQLRLDKQKKLEDKFFWEKDIGLTTKNIAQNRDMNHYAQGGHFDCRKWGTKDENSFGFFTSRAMPNWPKAGREVDM